MYPNSYKAFVIFAVSTVAFACTVYIGQILAAPLYSRQTTLQVFLPIVNDGYITPTWQYSNLGGDVTDLILDKATPGHAYATVYLDGLFETHDGGDSWIELWGLGRINDIEIHPITSTQMYLAVWGGGGSGGIWKSTDGGKSWSRWFDRNNQLISVAIFPLSPTFILAGTSMWQPPGGYTYKIYEDNNSDWYVVMPENTFARTFAFDPISSTIIYAGTNSGVWRSLDRGDTWQQMENTPLSKTYAITFHPHNPYQIYVSTAMGLFISVDGMNSWYPILDGMPIYSFLFHPTDANMIFAGTSNAIYVSQDAGKHWLPLGKCGASVGVNHLFVDPFDDKVLWVATNDGLWQCVMN